VTERALADLVTLVLADEPHGFGLTLDEIESRTGAPRVELAAVLLGMTTAALVLARGHRGMHGEAWESYELTRAGRARARRAGHLQERPELVVAFVALGVLTLLVLAAVGACLAWGAS
jgi:hypothetical protein